MDVKPRLSPKPMRKPATAAAPQPGSGESGRWTGQVAGHFAEALANAGEQTARAAMTGGADPHALVRRWPRRSWPSKPWRPCATRWSRPIRKS
jgi:flagellar hook-basal body complex protein FliE